MPEVIRGGGLVSTERVMPGDIPVTVKGVESTSGINVFGRGRGGATSIPTREERRIAEEREAQRRIKLKQLEELQKKARLEEKLRQEKIRKLEEFKKRQKDEARKEVIERQLQNLRRRESSERLREKQEQQRLTIQDKFTPRVDKAPSAYQRFLGYRASQIEFPESKFTKVFRGIVEDQPRVEATRERIFRSNFTDLSLPEKVTKSFYFTGEKIADITINPLFKTESKEGGKIIGETLMLGGLIGGAGARGTAQQSEFTEAIIGGRRVFIKKSDLEKLLNAPVKSGNVVRYNLNYNEKAERVRTLIKNLKNPSDKKSVDRILKLAKENYGDDFVKEFKAQEIDVPIVRPARVETEVIQPQPETLSKPSSLGGGQSIYFGKGQYEKTDEVGTILKPKQDSKTDVLQSTGQDVFQGKGQTSRARQGFNVLTGQTSKTDVMQKPKQDTQPKLNLLSKSIQDNQLFQRLQQRFGRQTRRGEGQKPKKPRRGVFFDLPEVEKEKTKTKSKESLFSLFLRKGGKDILSGVFENPTEAGIGLRSKLRTRLAASGFVETKGSKVSPSDLGIIFGEEFRPSKSDPLRVVERRSKRLRKGTTGKDIQFFRKSKGGKNLL